MDQETYVKLKEAYLTGFFDGEGCVSIGNNGNITLRVINTGYPVLLDFKDFFGGSIGERSQIVNKKQYTWSVYGFSAIEVARKMLPFSIEKREQLATIIEWYRERDGFSGVRIPGVKGVHADPDRIIRIRDYKKRLTNMKKGIVND